MVRRKVCGIAAGFAAVGMVLASAQPAVAQSEDSDVHVLTALAGPANLLPKQLAPAIGVRSNAVSPTISPSVYTTHDWWGYYRCSSGSLCAAVYDPTTEDYKIFHMARCTTYTMANWEGDGSYNNNQTGNVTSYFYDQDWNEIRSSTAPEKSAINWSPVWHINNC
jgi:hypothetical protein